MSRSNRVGTVNPFAALDSDEEDDNQNEPSKIPPAISDAPVHFALKGVHWTKERACTELKNFNVQWIKKDRAGVLYLQFESEIEGVKVIEWLQQKHRLNFTVSKTALKKDPKCFLCYREDHWGPQCREGLLASFPREIICLIASNLHTTELLRLKNVSRSFNSAIATMRSLYLDDPYYDEYGGQKQSRKFRSHFLRTFTALEELSLHDYDAEAIEGPDFNIIDYIVQCKSLRSLTLRSCELTDRRTKKESPHFSKLLALARLTKLIVMSQEAVSNSSIQLLGNLTNLVDLGLTVSSDDIFDNSLDNTLMRLPILTRLELKNTRTWDKEARLILSPETMTRLVSLKTRHFPAGICFGADMNKLEALNVDDMKDWYPLVAPNLTRLICRCKKMMGHINEYSSLKYVKLDIQSEEKLVISLPNLETLEISMWFEDADLIGCTNLKKLSVMLLKKDFTWQLPPSIVHLGVDPSRASPQAIKALCELPNLEILDITRPLIPADVLKVLAQITTLRSLSFRNVGANIALNEDFVTGLANFTQLKVLDLIRYDVWNTEAYQISKPLILNLSEKLPNTRILHGVLNNRDTLIKYDEYRPDHGSNCSCTRCNIMKQEELEEYKREKYEENRAAMHVPEKFNKYWYT